MGTGTMAGWSGLLEDTTTALRKTAEAAEAQEWAAMVKKQAERADEAEGFNAGNLAEKLALRKALRKLDPKHPLLTNQELVRRLHKSAQSAFAINRNWDDCRAVGENFEP